MTKNIILIEPLLVSDVLLTQLSSAFAEDGHTFSAVNVKGMPDADAAERLKDAHVLIIANTPISQTVLEQIPQLEMISVAFTGVDHVPLDYCREKGITVCNSQGYATRAVVEQAFGMLFSLYRKLPQADAGMRNGELNGPYFGKELHGQTFGLIGLGAIGEGVAEIALAFGCKVVAYNRSPKPELAAKGIEFMSMEAVFAEADVVSLHLPLMPETKHLVGKKLLSSMKPEAVLINTARGPIVDNAALADILLEGKIGGACLDVHDMEPPIPEDYPILKVKENIVIAPHTAFGTDKSFIKRAHIVFDNVSQWLAGSPVNVKV